MDTHTTNILVIYHRVDYDGLFSNAIVRHFAYIDVDDKVFTSYGYNYGDNLDLIPSFDDFDYVVMADISLPIEKMKEIHDKYFDKVIWIDHHITAIQNSEANGYADFNGVRDIKHSACRLCWEFFSEREVPYVIELINANDIWKKDSVYDWDDEIQALQYGLSFELKMSSEAICDNFIPLCFGTYAYSLKDMGLKVKEYMESLYKTWCERYSFPVTVNGKWKGLAMISPMFTSKVFTSIEEEYDCFVVLEKNGPKEGVYNISIYSGNRQCDDLNCGGYLQEKYNGGGHKGAGGGTLNFDEFSTVLSSHIV